MKNVYFQLLGVATIFFTNFINAQSVAFEENFDAGIPSSFVLYNEDGRTPHSSVAEYTNAWIAKEDPDDNTNTVASATSYFEPAGLADRYLITPAIQLGAFGNRLSWTAKSHDASFPERYLVLLSRTGTAIENFTDTIARVINEDVVWVRHEYNLSELELDNETVHIAFVLRSIDGFKIYVDSINVTKEDPVSILDIDDVQFSVYPNPAVDQITVKSDAQIEEVIVRDLKGSQILQVKNSRTINVGLLSTGVYFVEVRTDKGFATKRFVKK